MRLNGQALTTTLLTLLFHTSRPEQPATTPSSRFRDTALTNPRDATTDHHLPQLNPITAKAKEVETTHQHKTLKKILLAAKNANLQQAKITQQYKTLSTMLTSSTHRYDYNLAIFKCALQDIAGLKNIPQKTQEILIIALLLKGAYKNCNPVQIEKNPEQSKATLIAYLDSLDQLAPLDKEIVEALSLNANNTPEDMPKTGIQQLLWLVKHKAFYVQEPTSQIVHFNHFFPLFQNPEEKQQHFDSHLALIDHCLESPKLQHIFELYSELFDTVKETPTELHEQFQKSMRKLKLHINYSKKESAS